MTFTETLFMQCMKSYQSNLEVICDGCKQYRLLYGESPYLIVISPQTVIQEEEIKKIENKLCAPLMRLSATFGPHEVLYLTPKMTIGYYI